MNDEIIKKIQGVFSPTVQTALSLVRQDTLHRTPHLIFRFSADMLEIGKLAEIFDDVKNITWFGNAGDEAEKPSIVFDGRILGKTVQVVFILSDE
jgi:hypothetical protein